MKTIIKEISFAFLILALGFTGCTKDNEPKQQSMSNTEIETEPFVAIPTELIIVSGENQISRVESTLAEPIEVQLLDQEGNPFAGETIVFSTQQGSLSTETAITNTEGKTAVDWTLGNDVGEQNLTVSVAEVEDELIISAEATLVKGDFYKGGIVFYIDDSKKHGFVCSLNDLGSVPWGCPNVEVDGANGTAPGAGAQNTRDIEKDCATAGTAADICANLELNGFTDWFLPGRELGVQLAINSSKIREGAVSNGGAGLGESAYWTSTEFGENEAYRVELPVGGRRGLPKTSLFGVRAIREF